MPKNFPSDIQTYIDAANDPGNWFLESFKNLKFAKRNNKSESLKSSSGTFGIVLYEESRAHVFKFFIDRTSENIIERYKLISDGLKKKKSNLFVEFELIENKLRILSHTPILTVPFLKMENAKGVNINEYFETIKKSSLHHNKTSRNNFLKLWLEACNEINFSNMAHGDLQHGNIMIDYDKSSSDLKPKAIKLIDYDGIWLPELKNLKPNEKGHRNYNLPSRSADQDYGPTMDYFSQLIIATSIVVLSKIPDDTDTEETLVFKEDDIKNPQDSKLFKILWNDSDQDIRNLTGHLILATKSGMQDQKPLNEYFDNYNVKTLTKQQTAKIAGILNPNGPTSNQANSNPSTQKNPSNWGPTSAPGKTYQFTSASTSQTANQTNTPTNSQATWPINKNNRPSNQLASKLKDFFSRRKFIKNIAIGGIGSALVGSYVAKSIFFNPNKTTDPNSGNTPLATPIPKVTFFGAAGMVSGSCYLMETGLGDVLIDCGLFFGEKGGNEERLNNEFNFDPKKIKALFLTHAHLDHLGRIPQLFSKGFTGDVYTTEVSRKLSLQMLSMGRQIQKTSMENASFNQTYVSKALNNFTSIPYGLKIDLGGASFRFTESGHILGSAMVEIWSNGKKVIFSGDMGPDNAPLMRPPDKHSEADLVLVESTYGSSARINTDFEGFGKKISQTIKRGGDVLIPAFVLHKTQTLIYVLHSLKKSGVIPKDVPIICDSKTAQYINKIYNTHTEFFKQNVYFSRTDFLKENLKELSPKESLDFKKNNSNPVIFISASGMLDFASAPRHLCRMAENPLNSVILVGYQAPYSNGGRLLSSPPPKSLSLPSYDIFSDETTEIPIKIPQENIIKWSNGFSSHASGQQITEWIKGFQRIGEVAVVHGEKHNSIALANKIKEMGIGAFVPTQGQTHLVNDGQTSPGNVNSPWLETSPVIAPTDT